MAKGVRQLIDVVASFLQGLNLEISDGVVAGVFALLGVMVERLLRLTGRLRFEASRWERTGFSGYSGGEDEYHFGLIPDERAEKEATQVGYRVAIDLFNGKEVPAGLQDIKIVLIHEDGKRSPPSQPRDLTTSRQTQYKVYVDELAVINVPPRQFVHKELEGTFGREEAMALATGKWKQVEFVGKRPKRPLLWRNTESGCTLCVCQRD